MLLQILYLISECYKINQRISVQSFIFLFSGTFSLRITKTREKSENSENSQTQIPNIKMSKEEIISKYLF